MYASTINSYECFIISILIKFTNMKSVSILVTDDIREIKKFVKV